jgi:hypothetical protein
MTDPRSSDPIARRTAAQVATTAGLDTTGRWAVRVEARGDDRLDELHVTAIASCRVHAVIDRTTIAGHDEATIAQAVGHKLGNLIRAELVSTTGADAADAERVRRLHEEATQRSADLRTALEALVEAAKWYSADGETATLDAAIDAAKELLA